MSLPIFPTDDFVYQFEFNEEIVPDVNVTKFQSGRTFRSSFTSRKTRRFRLKYKVLTSSDMDVLERFYNEVNGTQNPFLFKPPIELLSRFTQLATDGSQKLEDFTNSTLRANSDQSYVVRFTQPFNRNLFDVLLESTGLLLEEVIDENPKGQFMRMNGLQHYYNYQNAFVLNFQQDYLDMGEQDFMLEFRFRAETVFRSSNENYVVAAPVTLTATIDSVAYNIDYPATTYTAETVVKEINDQQGAVLEAKTIGDHNFYIRSRTTGYFTLSGATLISQWNLDAGTIYPLYKHDGIDTGYYFKQDGVGDLTFFIEESGTPKTITANSSFHLMDGIWHYIAVTMDRDGNGQIYVDGSTSGSAVDISGLGSLDNSSDFWINFESPRLIDMDEIRIWRFGIDGLPATIATTISDHFSDPFRVPDQDDDGAGLYSRYKLDGDGEDDNKQERLTLMNDPIFVQFIEVS